jgi:uncharacterized membrane protein YhhN
MSIGPVTVWRTIARQPWERVLFLASLVCGVGCLLAPYLPGDLVPASWPIHTVIKGLAVSTLVPLVWHWLPGTNGKLLSIALAFSSLGDVFLALPGGNYFIYGLLSFLIAHLFFITLWRRNWPVPLRSTAVQKALLGVLALYVLGMMGWILPVPGQSAAVAAYMLVLTSMAMAAVLVRVSHVWIGSGAILFLISDSLIALSTFKQLIGGRWAGFLIWSTYYLAQYLMTFGFVLSKRNRRILGIEAQSRLIIVS